jgi:hypothetical protein
MSTRLAAVLPLAFAFVAGCGDRPQPRPPEPAIAAPRAPSSPVAVAPEQAAELFRRVSGPDDDTTKMEVAGIVAPKPAQWTWQQPTMQFRDLQYAVPAPGASAGSAELIVSVFLEGDGGPTETNIDRWVGQFRTAEGGRVESNRQERTIDGMRVILLDLAGTYQGMGGTGPRPDFRQLSAIVEAQGRRIFIRLLGPTATVEANVAQWNALIEGLRDTAKP